MFKTFKPKVIANFIITQWWSSPIDLMKFEWRLNQVMTKETRDSKKFPSKLSQFLLEFPFNEMGRIIYLIGSKRKLNFHSNWFVSRRENKKCI